MTVISCGGFMTSSSGTRVTSTSIGFVGAEGGGGLAVATKTGLVFARFVWVASLAGTVTAPGEGTGVMGLVCVATFGGTAAGGARLVRAGVTATAEGTGGRAVAWRYQSDVAVTVVMHSS